MDGIQKLVIEKYNFKLVDNWLGILTGQEEASLDWINIEQSQRISREQDILFPYVIENEENIENYDLENENLGILDLGGSSLEISFVPLSNTKPDDKDTFQKVKFNEQEIKLYSVSYEGLGHNSAYENHEKIIIDYYYSISDYSNRYIDPCLPKNSVFYGKTESPSGDKVIFDGKFSLQNEKNITNLLLYYDLIISTKNHFTILSF